MGNETAHLPVPALLDRALVAGKGITIIESSWINGHFHFQAYDDKGNPLYDKAGINPLEHSVRFRDGKAAVDANTLRDLKLTKHWGRTIDLVGKLGETAEKAKVTVIRSKEANAVQAKRGTLGKQSKATAARKAAATKKAAAAAKGLNAQSRESLAEGKERRTGGATEG